MRRIIILTMCSMAVNATDPQNHQAPPPARGRSGLLRAAAAVGIGALIGGGMTAMHHQNIGQVSDYVSKMDLRAHGGSHIYHALLQGGHPVSADMVGMAVRSFDGPTRHADVTAYCSSLYERCFDLNSWSGEVHYNSMFLYELKKKLEEDIILAGGNDEQQLLSQVRALKLPPPSANLVILEPEVATQIRKQATTQFAEAIKSFEFAVAKREKAVAKWEQLLGAFADLKNAANNEEASTAWHLRTDWEKPLREKFERELDAKYEKVLKRRQWFGGFVLDDEFNSGN